MWLERRVGEKTVAAEKGQARSASITSKRGNFAGLGVTTLLIGCLPPIQIALACESDFRTGMAEERCGRSVSKNCWRRDANSPVGNRVPGLRWREVMTPGS